MTPTQSTHEAIDTLQLRLYKLTTKSHLRIGAGEGSISLSAADNPVIQALFYQPPAAAADKGAQERVIYLPGSSLHGVIRAWSEKIHRSRAPFLAPDVLRQTVADLDENQRNALLNRVRAEVKDLLGRDPDDAQTYDFWRVHPLVCDPLSLLDQCQRFGAAAEGQVLPAKQEWFEKLHPLGRENPCPVCQVFGYVGQRGRVRVQHAFPGRGVLPLDIITRVAINRISGAADEGKLFDMEAVPPGAVFYFFVVLENLNVAQLATFESGIRALQLQLATLGAHSTVGFGTVEVEPVVTASIGRSLFDQADLPEQVQGVVRGNTYHLRDQAADLAAARYPSFYRALAMVDRQGRPPAFFDGHVTFADGAG